MQSPAVEIPTLSAHHNNGPRNESHSWLYSPSGRYAMVLHDMFGHPECFVTDTLEQVNYSYECIVSKIKWANVVTNYWVRDDAIVVVSADTATDTIHTHICKVDHQEKTLRSVARRSFDVDDLDAVHQRRLGVQSPLKIGSKEYVVVSYTSANEPGKTKLALLPWFPWNNDIKMRDHCFRDQAINYYLEQHHGEGSTTALSSGCEYGGWLFCPVVDADLGVKKALCFFGVELATDLESSDCKIVSCPLPAEFTDTAILGQMINLLIGSQWIFWTPEAVDGKCTALIADISTGTCRMLRLNVPPRCFSVRVGIHTTGRLDVSSYHDGLGHNPPPIHMLSTVPPGVAVPATLAGICRGRLLQRDLVHLLSDEILDRFPL